MKKNISLIDMFLQDKPTKILVEMFINSQEPIYGSTLAKRIDCTYSHVIKILKLFEQKGIVEVKRSGRLNYLELTEKGKRVGKALSELVGFLSRED
ncbi:MAG: MarR family winged helix-turn-helix transcriptional regulator [Candidatus Woesearchaeota archaeon]